MVFDDWWNMEKILEIALLYDFYGELLTEKQKQIFELYYNNDLSLSEIGEELGISRQAVRDQIKRTEQILQQYENKLSLVEKFLKQKQEVLHIKELIVDLETKFNLPPEMQQRIEAIREIAAEILS